MTIYKDYKIAVFLNEKDLKLNKCVVRFRAKKGNSFKVNLKELLMLTPGKSILSKDKRVVLKHISLDKVAITDGDNRVTYTDFHTVREWVRRKLLMYCLFIRPVLRRSETMPLTTVAPTTPRRKLKPKIVALIPGSALERRNIMTYAMTYETRMKEICTVILSTLSCIGISPATSILSV